MEKKHSNPIQNESSPPLCGYSSPLMGALFSPAGSTCSTPQGRPVYLSGSTDGRYSSSLSPRQSLPNLFGQQYPWSSAGSTLRGDTRSTRESRSPRTTTWTHHGNLNSQLPTRISCTTILSSFHLPASQVTLTFTFSNLLGEKKKISSNEITLVSDLQNQVRILPPRFEELYFLGKITPHHLRTQDEKEYAIILRGQRFLLREDLTLGEVGVKSNDTLYILRTFTPEQAAYILEKQQLKNK